MSSNDNSYQVTGKVCPPSLPMSMMMTSGEWSGSVSLGALKSLLIEHPAHEARHSLPDSLCALVSQAQVLLSTDKRSLVSSVVSLPYYFCNFCDHHTDSKALLLKHTAEKHIFQCSLCNFFSFTRCSLVQHQLKAHIDAEELLCMLSTKFMQLNPSQLQKRLQSEGLLAPSNALQRHDGIDGLSGQVSSASSYHEDNFLLFPDSRLPSATRDTDFVHSMPHSGLHSHSCLEPEIPSFSGIVSDRTDSLPHFLDVSSSRVSRRDENGACKDKSRSKDCETHPSSSSLVDSPGISRFTDPSLYCESIPGRDSCDQAMRRTLLKDLSPALRSPLSTEVLQKQNESSEKGSDIESNPCGSFLLRKSTQYQRCHHPDIGSRHSSPETPAATASVGVQEEADPSNFLIDSKQVQNESEEKNVSQSAQAKSERSVKPAEAFLEEKQCHKSKSFDILRGLLIGETRTKPKAAAAKNTSEEKQRAGIFLHQSSTSKTMHGLLIDTIRVSASSESNTAQPKRASDMSLKELLTQPSPPCSFEPSKQKDPKRHYVAPSVLICNFCNFKCDSKSLHRTHVDKCRRRVHPCGNTSSFRAETSAHTTQSESSSAFAVRPDLEDSDSDVVEMDSGSRGVDASVSSALMSTAKSSLIRDSCVASEMLRTMSQTYSNSRLLPSQTSSFAIGHEASRKARLVSRSQENTSPQTLASKKASLMEPNRSRRSNKFRERYDNYLSDEDANGEPASSKDFRSSKKRQRDEDDADYVCDIDTGESSSEESDISSSDSVDEVRRRSRSCKKAKFVNGVKNALLGNVLTCLHCSYSYDHKPTIRKHLRIGHPNCVPFATASLNNGKNTIVYFCQGFDGKCSFVSSKGAEILAHIKLCYMEMLDNFIVKHQPDFSPVLCSMGIASKLIDSSPSTFYCLRCEYSKHSLQPMVGHIAENHKQSVAGVLHVTLGNSQPKHTQVFMMCVTCKSDISANQWTFHTCRLQNKKWVENRACSSHERNASGRRLDQESTSNRDFTTEHSKSFLKAPGITSGAAEAVTFCRNVAAGVKDDSFKVKDEISQNDEVKSKASLTDSSNDESVGITDDSEDGVRIMATRESQSPETRNVCVISSCFSVTEASASQLPAVTPTPKTMIQSKPSLKNPTTLSKQSSDSPDSCLGNSDSISQASPFDSSTATASKHPLQASSTKEKSETVSSTSVLHDLLVSNPPDLSSTRALTLLQSLLSGPKAALNPSTLGELPKNPVSSASPAMGRHTGMEQKPLVTSDHAFHEHSEHQSETNHERKGPTAGSNTEAGEIELCCSSAAIKMEIDTDTECERDAQDSQPAESVSESGHRGCTSLPNMSTLTLPTFIDPAKPATATPHLSPPTVIPTPPQLPAHLRPLSPSSPPPSISGHQPGGAPSLFPSASSEPLHPSPFTNLLRGLLSMSQQKDRENSDS
ncbi:hypothetical protein PoB_003737200 [Plakobranchus ocellatus]|uniref:C2H2-type domain-containing protein n=1 Tax=Plakobranchus ocellatus TaxID=259542 RepID=A0AAV4AU68_9GAST|nr:hypothetical protein PoB_003737200 [Plakobranchus ocellatus]